MTASITPVLKKATLDPYDLGNYRQRRSNIRTGSAAYFLLIWFLVNFLCIVAPPVGTTSRRVWFVFFYRTSYVRSSSHQHLATVIRYFDCVKQHFQTSRRHLMANYTKFITRLLRLCYRPISNLTFLSKLLERAAYEQIVGYLDRFQLLPELQSAYRKHRSIVLAAINVMSDVYEAADTGFVTLLGLFDLVWHGRPSHSTRTQARLRCQGTSHSVDRVLSHRMQSIQRLYQSPPVCRRGPSWGRYSSYLSRLKSLPSFSIRASKCTLLPMTYKYTDRRHRTVLLMWLLVCRSASSVSRHGWAQIDSGSIHPRQSWFG